MDKRETAPMGMVGLGNMGLPIALNLIKTGRGPVYGYDVVPAARNRFGASGGLSCNTAEEVFLPRGIFQPSHQRPGAGKP